MSVNPEATFEIEYALACLRDAIDLAYIEGDFAPARRWVNEIEKTYYADLKTHVNKPITAFIQERMVNHG